MSPTKEEKIQLFICGNKDMSQQDLAYAIVNQFLKYSEPEVANQTIFNEYWFHKLCVLAERCALAEKKYEAEVQKRW